MGFEEWEVRRYPATKWISTDARDVMPHDGPESSKAFYRLFHYIDGSNNLNTKIPMTAPVTMRIFPGEGPDCESNFTMSFYIPSDMQEDPPLPTEDRVYIEERNSWWCPASLEDSQMTLTSVVKQQCSIVLLVKRDSLLKMFHFGRPSTMDQ